MNQALEIIRLLGLPKAIRVKKRFDQALPHVRGYAICSCLWALLETGALDKLLEADGLALESLTVGGLDRHVLESIFSYMDGVGLVRVEGGRVRIHTPLIRRSKADIVRTGTRLGVDFRRTTSCYDPDRRGRACGRCAACRIRRKGFADAGIQDMTVYHQQS